MLCLLMQNKFLSIDVELQKDWFKGLKMRELHTQQNLINMSFSLLSAGIYCSYRIRYCCFIFQGNPDSAIQAKAIEFLPLLLITLGSPCHCLVFEDLHPLVRSADENVQTKVAQICGELGCAFSGESTLQTFPFEASKCVSKTDFEDTKPVLHCKICQEGKCIVFIIHL